MKLIFCISKNNGLFFIDKRQSSDKIITDLIVEDCIKNNSKLYVSKYSSELFKGYAGLDVSIIDEDSKIEDKDTVFLEDLNVINYINDADKVTIINWNREYPATKHFDKTLLTNFYLLGEYTVKGNSHDKIIIQNYQK